MYLADRARVLDDLLGGWRRTAILVATAVRDAIGEKR